MDEKNSLETEMRQKADARHRRRVSISLPHSLFRSLFISLPRFHLPPKCRECNGLVVE